MNIKRLILSFLYLLLFCFFSKAQTWNFRHLTVDEGLSQNSVVDITQDTFGFLWVATQDGLNCLDGKDISIQERYFVDITGSASFRLGHLYVDGFNKLWLTNIDGQLGYFEADRKDFSIIPEINNANCIYHELEGHHWIGTYGEGLFWIDSLAQLQQLKGTEEWQINQIQSPKEGQLLIGTQNGFYRIDSKQKVLSSPTLLGKNVSSFSKTDSLLYVGTYGNGLFVQSDAERIQPHIALPSSARILDIFTDSQNRTWVATYGDGLYLIVKNQLFKHFTFDSKDDFSINYNDILCIFEDQSGTIWFGTDGGGLSYFKQQNNQFNALTKNQVEDNIAIDVVRSISVDSKGIIWIGTSGKGLTKYQSETNFLKTYTTASSSILSNRIMSLWHDARDNLYIGTQGNGLGKLDTKGQFSTFDQLPCQTVWTIHPAPNNQLWLGTRNHGLILFNPTKNTWKSFSFVREKDSGDGNIRALTSADEQTYYVGTQDNGIAKFDLDKEGFSSIDLGMEFTPSKLGAIKCLYLKNSILWIGTQRAGLLGYDLKDKSIHQFDKSKGLPNNVVYGIQEDDNGFFWLTTNQGICQLDTKTILDADFAKSLVAHYTVDDGIVCNEFNTGATFQTSDGQLFFGGLDGINWFYPTQIQQDKTTSEIQLLKIVYQQEKELIEQSLLSRKIIRLHPTENNFQIHFSALQFPHSTNTKFQYKLDGFQKNWIDNQNFGIATFSNIPHGNYTFQVRSQNKTGQWITSPTKLNITIDTPWYKTTWAWIAYFLTLLGIAYLFYLFQKRRWQLKAELQLEKQEKIRLEELDQFKTQFFTNISHEIRTPLTLIKGMGEQLDYSKTRTVLLKNTQHLIDLTNQILDLSKLEAGLLQANFIQSDIIPYLKVLIESFESLAKNKGINLTFESTISSLIMDFDAERLRQIIVNLISNAIKFTPSKGEVAVFTSQQNQHLLIKVIDTGIGIPSADLPHIFNRYFQVNHSNSSIGSGIGLALVRELIQLFKGKIHVESQPTKGTTFVLFLPIVHTAPIQSAPYVVEKKEVIATEIIHSEKKDAFQVLIIEDNLEVAQYIATCIQSDYNYSIAKDGKEGLEMALASIPDLIISDVAMPKMDGYEVCRILKTDEKTNHIPIILLTAKASQQNKLIGLKKGADAYLVKPFEVTELQIRVQQLIQLRQKLQIKYQQAFTLETILENKPSIANPPFLKKLDAILEQYLQKEDFDIPFLCEQLQMSRMQVHRKLKALTNRSTTQYITSFRLQKSLPLLKEGSLTISEIAYQVGFNDPNYFSRCFVKEFGKKPSEIKG